MDSNICYSYASLLFVITLCLILKKRQSRPHGKQQPPGPPGWPVIGNILELGSNPHQSLYKLRFKYGDIVWLRLGWTNTLVIQTAKAAEHLFKNHDASFCDRKVPQAWTAHNYTLGSLSVGRYTSYWRILRRLVTSGLSSNKKVQETAFLRRKCIDNMIKCIEEDVAAAQQGGESGEVEVCLYVFNMTFNLVGNLVLSRDIVGSQTEEGNEFFHEMERAMELGGAPNLSDFFPLLKGLDLQRIKTNMEKHLQRIFSIVEKLVMERIENGKLIKENDYKDLLATFLEYNESGRAEGDEIISTHNMIIIIAEMFFGGTDTTSATIEWVMTELFCNPECMKKVKEELNQVVGPQRKVEESDINQLSYLQAVIKETMRLHPIVPFLVPRNAIEDTNFMGYVIPKDTQVFVNTWAIGRDPEAWDDPLKFKPERFMGSNIQYRDQNFELLPFGSGRRICVGYPLAHQILHLTTASLLHSFDWKVDSKSVANARDMSERLGLTVRKLIPFKAIPKKILAE